MMHAVNFAKYCKILIWQVLESFILLCAFLPDSMDFPFSELGIHLLTMAGCGHESNARRNAVLCSVQFLLVYLSLLML